MSKVTVVFEGNNAEEVESAIADYVSSRRVGSSVSPVLSGGAANDTAKEADKSAKKTKKESAPVEQVAAPVVEEADPFGNAPTVAAEEPVTQEAVFAALKEVGAKHTIVKVREVLAGLGVKTITQLKPEQLPAAMAACKKALG